MDRCSRIFNQVRGLELVENCIGVLKMKPLEELLTPDEFETLEEIILNAFKRQGIDSDTWEIEIQANL